MPESYCLEACKVFHSLFIRIVYLDKMDCSVYVNDRFKAIHWVTATDSVSLHTRTGVNICRMLCKCFAYSFTQEIRIRISKTTTTKDKEIVKHVDLSCFFLVSLFNLKIQHTNIETMFNVTLPILLTRTFLGVYLAFFQFEEPLYEI